MTIYSLSSEQSVACVTRIFTPSVSSRKRFSVSFLWSQSAKDWQQILSWTQHEINKVRQILAGNDERIISNNLNRTRALRPCNCFLQTFRLCLHSVFQPVFFDGTFDVFDVMCKHLHSILLNTFFNRLKNGLKNATCKRTFTLMLRTILIFSVNGAIELDAFIRRSR